MQVIFFTGYPGSGKGTQGKNLCKILDLPHISTGELFRSEAKTGSDIGNKMKFYMDQGLIIPNELHFSYLRQHLMKFSRGFILDGYPKNIECFKFIIDFLNSISNSISNPMVINLEISRAEAIKRLSSRVFCNECEISAPKEQSKCSKCFGNLVIRHDDNYDTISKRLDIFENDTKPLFNIYKKMGILKTINGSLDPEQVLINILMELFPHAANAPILSIFHNHIDAKNKDLVEEINQKIMNIVPKDKYIKHKTYSVEHLLLGNQSKDLIYKNMPNFHQITNATEEAFSTCKMGEELNYEQTMSTLEIVYDYKGNGVMTEIEEELVKFNINENNIYFTLIRQCKETIDWKKFGKFKNKNLIINSENKNILFELHHGFEIPKIDDKLPINLQELSDITSNLGFHNGGWFIFKDQTRWLYRSNEFSELSYNNCINILVDQSRILQKIFSETKLTINSSLERVHGIWSIDHKKQIFINTSNNDKLKEYQKYLIDYEVISTDLELDEPDSDSITIVRYKASKLPNDYIIDDVSLDIQDETIGTNIKWYIDKLDQFIGKNATFNCFIGITPSDI
jgi:adenylate kinase